MDVSCTQDRTATISHVEAFHNSSNVSLQNSTINSAQTITVNYHSVQDSIDIADWLTIINFRSIQNDTYSKSTPGTGSWFLERPEFKEWISTGHRALWGIGIPGAGKTILSSIVINHLQSDFAPDMAVVFAYCRYTDQYTVRDILASLVKQLVQGYTSTFDIVKALFTRHTANKTRPSEPELLVTLRRCAALFSKFYVVLDALDEFSDEHRYPLFNSLLSLECCLFLTSRPLDRSDDLVADSVVVEIIATNEDIERFINEKFEKVGRLKSLVRGKASVKSEILSKVQEKSRGMFLLATLQLESLKATVSVNNLRRVLENLPEGVNHMYRATLERIERQSGDDIFLAKRALVWVAHAFKLLSVGELQEALGVTPGNLVFSEDDISPMDLLVSLCCGLITVDTESNSVRLIHYTAQNFLETLQLDPIHVPRPHAFIAYTCTTYLSIHRILDQDFENEWQLDTYLQASPLLGYAYNNWAIHMLRGRSGYDSADPSFQFLCAIHKYPWVDENIGMKEEHVGKHFDYLDSLQLVACLGISDALEHVDIHSHPTARYRNTALHLGALYGHAAIVKKLLASGRFGVNAANLSEDTALIQAARNGHAAVVELLIACDDIELNASNNYGHTALIQASKNGHHAVVNLLISRQGVKWEVHDRYGYTALIEASKSGHDAVVELLLTCDGIDVNACDDSGMTALMWAVRGLGHEATVKTLLDYRGVDVNAVDSDGVTALIWASWLGYEGIAKLLLACDGINVNANNTGGETAFSLAAGGGYDGLVKLLLAYGGVDINAKDVRGGTALIWASCNDQEAVVELLVARDEIDMNSTDHDGDTALSNAAGCGHDAIVKLLLTNEGIDVNARNRDGATTLIIACQGTLVDVNTSEEEGETELIEESGCWREAIVKLLLSCKEIDVNARNRDGETALMKACARTHVNTNNDLDPVLVNASGRGHEAIVKMLLAYEGIDVNASNQEGNTALLKACEGIIYTSDEDGVTNVIDDPGYWRGAIVKLLLNCEGIDVSASNRKGETALKKASEHEDSQGILRLLKNYLEKGIE